MPQIPQELLINKQEHLGTIRQAPLTESHIWSSIAPWMEVAHDDVIFDIATPDVYGMVPARAEDAESELAVKDDFFGQGSARILDWAIKDFYSASDINGYRDNVYTGDILRAGGNAIPTSFETNTQAFQRQLIRDTMRRRRSIENRIEYMTITQALVEGQIAYNDGKVKFTVPFGRPADQQDMAVQGSAFNVTDGSSDPIAEFTFVQDFMRDRHDIEMRAVLMSSKALRTLSNSSKFYARTGLGVTPAANTDIGYTIPGFNRGGSAQSIVEADTGLTIVVYDSAYRTRPIGDQNFGSTRFLPEDTAVFLPDVSQLGEILGTDIGFGRVLTSPHVEGNWQPGFYGYEMSDTDPWGYAIGTGLKFMPVFPNLEYTATLKLW